MPLYEITWNHTTLQMLKRDRGITYLQALHPAARLLESVAEIADRGAAVSLGDPAEIGRDLALATDARRIPVIDDHGRLVGILAITNDLQSFCGTTA